MSVPDSDLLISLCETLEAPVSRLFGKVVVALKIDTLKVITEKQEVINVSLVRKKA